MKAHRGHTPLTKWLNGGEHAAFLSCVPDISSPLCKSPVRKILIRGAPNITVLLSEKDREMLYEYLEKSCSYADFCNNYITPDDGKFAELSKILDVSREFYKAFFMDVVKNKRVDEGAFNKIIGPFLNAEMKFLTRSDPFHPKLGWQFHFESITIQDHIEYYEIIRPGLDQEDDTFAMMRICPKCSKLFVAKTNKTIFCSPSCRVMYQRQHGPEK